MRYREPYTVFKRTMKSGKIIWYYQTYDLEGNRTTARSTGQTNKSAARAFCLKLMKNDKLIPNTRGRMTFEEYSRNWWDWEKCEYVAYRKSRRNLSKNYVNNSNRFMVNDLVPYFGKLRLKDIRPLDIERWLQSFSKKGKSNQTANATFSILKIMLDDAVRRGYIKNTPAEKIKKLKNDGREKGVLTPAKAQEIFDKKNIDALWINKTYYMMNLTAASTGMRMGELQGLQAKHLIDGNILVEQQFNGAVGEITETKNHKSRTIPVSNELFELLNTLVTENPDGFVFSLCPKKSKPLTSQRVRNSLYVALSRVGISREEQRAQNITFHSWRHYFNTMMIRNNVPEQKIRMLTGHSSVAMTEHYTHMDHNDLHEIASIQNQILNFPRTDKVG